MWTVSGFLLLHEETREPSKKPWNKEAQIPKWNPGLCYGDAAPAVSPVSATRQHNEWRFLLNHLAWAFLLCLLQTCLHATQLGVPELRCNSSGFSAEMLQRWCSFKLLYIKNTFFFFFTGIVRQSEAVIYLINAVGEDAMVSQWSAYFSRCVCELKRGWWVSSAHRCWPVQPWADVSPPPPRSCSLPQELRGQAAAGPHVPQQPGGEAVETRR